jgi:hemoglobin
VEQPVAADSTLYSKLGEIDGIRQLVDQWILEAATDRGIRDHFKRADIARLKEHLVEYVCLRAGGPCLYRGRDLGEAHSGLKLRAEDLQAFWRAMDRALRRLQVGEETGRELRHEMEKAAAELAIE